MIPFNKKLIIACCGLSALSLATTAIAQDIGAKKDEPKIYTDNELYNMSLEQLTQIEVVTTSKMNLENESEAPAVVTVVTAEQIRNSGAKNMEEVLRTVAGFDVSRPSFSPNTTFGIRGLYSTDGTNNKILFMIDGHPFRSIFFGDATVFAGNMPLNNIARIEIIRGPGSTLFGAGAFLGVINIITRDAAKHAEVSIAAGSFGTYEVSALGTLKGKNNAFKTTISANHFATQGPRLTLHSDISKETLDMVGPQYGYNATASMAPGYLNYARNTSQVNVNSELGKFYAKALFMASDDQPPVGHYDALTRGNVYKNTAAYGETGFKTPIADKKGEFLLKTYLDYASQDYTQELWSSEAAQMFNFFTRINRPYWGLPEGTYYAAGEAQYHRTIARHRGIGAETNLAYNFGNNVKIITGVMYEQHKQYGVQTFANGNIFYEYTPAYAMQFDGNTYISLEAFGRERDISAQYNWNKNAGRSIFAAFGQAEIDFLNLFRLNGAGKNLSMVLGGRYDHYSDAGDAFNPRAALLYSPTDKLYFKALYGTAFRAPSFSEEYTANNSFAVGNPDLTPETVITKELVAGYKLNKTWEASIAYFNTEALNVIQLRGTAVNGSLAKQYANIGDYDSKGAELSVRYMPHAKVSLFTNFTYQYATDHTRDTISITMSDGEVKSFTQEEFLLGDVPMYMANMGVNYALTKNINFNLSGNYVGPRHRTEAKIFEHDPQTYQPTGNIMYADTREDISARLLLNASLRLHSFAFAPGLELQLSGYNLANAKNYNAALSIHKDDIRREGANMMGRILYKF
jgi:outer membrane receptor protein involved in Fe transport